MSELNIILEEFKRCVVEVEKSTGRLKEIADRCDLPTVPSSTI